MDAFAALELELKKVSALGGTMAFVVVPQQYVDKALACKRDLDTAITYREYVVIGMFGVGVDEAAALFLSVPKGVSVYPKDGDDVQVLFFVAMERLRRMDSSPWVRRLWDTIKETKTCETRESPENRFILSSFYQFYAFLASHTAELGTIFSNMGHLEQDWVKDLLPYGIARDIHEAVPKAALKVEDLNALIDGWGYQARMEEKQVQGEKTLRKFRNIEHLFTLPSISRQIIDIARDPLLSASNMASLIEKDPVLTSKLLKVVNSAFYGFHRQIDSVEHAVVILGNVEVINLAFSIAVFKIMKDISRADAQQLWEHSLTVAHLSQWLGPIMGCTAGDQIYTLGLLHDLGKIVFLQSNEHIGTLSACSSLEDLAAEEQASGLSHAEMGAYVAERWNLPEGIVDGLLSHHIPGKAKFREQAMTVHLADGIAHNMSLDLDRLSNAAVSFLAHKKGAALTADMVHKAYENISTRVRYILDL